MHHHFIGVEHLVIGSLMLRGGICATLMERYGYKPVYVIDMIRRYCGKGSRQRLWAGMPNTPRAEVVLSIANDLALEDERTEITERDLLRAVLEEADSIPMRVFSRLNIDPELFAQDILEFSSTEAIPLPYVKIEFSPAYDSDIPVNEEQLFILRRMFYGYARVRVEQRLKGGFSGALLLAVTPIQQDGTEDALVVVKIDDANIILDEAYRFEQQVKSTLPPLTARIEERPTAAETSDLAGLKYTFVSGTGAKPQDMREAAWTIGLAQLGAWLRSDLYPYFGRAWWEQRRPYRFTAWQEYDFLLPPLFILENAADAGEAPAETHILRDPIRRERLSQIQLGDTVLLAGFFIQQINRQWDSIQLTIGNGIEASKRANRVEIRDIALQQHTHFRGEVVDQMIGRVVSTRFELVLQSIRSLQPDFDPRALTIPVLPPLDRLPNPIHHYEQLLNTTINGSVSRIHGDLHLGNILLGPNNTGFLVDFAQSRTGHTLFDWATLEISLLNDLVMKTVGDSWADARRVLCHVAALADVSLAMPDPTIDDALSPLEALREIVAMTLARSGDWAEYWVALTFCTLRAVRWDSMPLGSKRLMYLLAGYCCSRLFTDGTPHFDSSMTAGGDLTDLSAIGGSAENPAPYPPD